MLVAISIVKLMEGWDSFNVVKRGSVDGISGTIAKVSSTYLLHVEGRQFVFAFKLLLDRAHENTRHKRA